MTRASQITGHFSWALDKAEGKAAPFAHWLLRDALPPEVARAIAALPFAPPDVGDSLGKRETHNSTRIFFSAQNRAAHAVCADVAAAFQSEAMVRALEGETGASLSGSYLRIEYCQDTDGFWLEPHTDIGAKRFTLLVYLSERADAQSLGTDIYDAARRRIGTASGAFNEGLFFVPGSDTWHGFEKRTFTGVRKSIIVNYVIPEWRSRHELAYPQVPVA
jgi:hypothetical protein